ncbi:MAG: mycofactocin biosynthesis chaperone MftB [Candidatus Lambdaproteobacteria bacterium]|nr:mycofactocin biosynthesis chaperone MftB [Candidatus Lambdaproteobacteria bacterium]
MDWSRSYRLAPGCAMRREGFGGILYHYEGVRPDPRVYFLDSPFLVGLLELSAEGPLDELIAQARAQFALTAQQEESVRTFFIALFQRGALVVR